MVQPETSIPCTKKTRTFIRDIGYKGETWDQLLQRIGTFYVEQHMKQSRRLKA